MSRVTDVHFYPDGSITITYDDRDDDFLEPDQNLDLNDMRGGSSEYAIVALTCFVSGLLKRVESLESKHGQ